MIENGKIIKFLDLDKEYQNAFFSTEEEIIRKGFIFYPNPMSKKGILFLGVFISVGSTIMLFVGGILASKIHFISVLQWTLAWFLFISLINLLWAYPQYKNTAVGSGYLLTDKHFIFFQNKNLVKILPIESIDIIEGKDGFVFRSGSVSFIVKYEYAADKKFSELFAEIIVRKPEFKDLLEKIGKT